MYNPTVPYELSEWHKVRTDFGKGKIINISKGIYKVLLSDGNIYGVYDKSQLSHIKSPSPEKLEQKLMKRFEKAKVKWTDYEWYQLPDQNNLPYINTEETAKGTVYIIFSQQDQNKSDELQYILASDYAEDRYIVNQNGKEYEFIGTFAKHTGDVEWPINTTDLSIEEYIKKFKDSVFLWVWKYNTTAIFE